MQTTSHLSCGRTQVKTKRMGAGMGLSVHCLRLSCTLDMVAVARVSAAANQLAALGCKAASHVRSAELTGTSI